jgi:hypothetical protein
VPAHRGSNSVGLPTCRGNPNRLRGRGGGVIMGGDEGAFFRATAGGGGCCRCGAGS